jgi:protein-disulfide isomerase
MWYTFVHMKNPWVIIGAITVILFGGAFWFASNAAEENNEGIEVTTHIKGNPGANVTLVEYSDLQCPACASFAPAVNEIIALYGDEIRFEYKHFPLPIHQFAVQAAVAAEAAGQQDKFFEYHDLLFENQEAWSRSSTPKSFFLQYAERLDLDMAMFRRQMSASLLRDHVQAQFAEGRELGITGTPTFFLNGKRMEIQTFQGFIEQVGRAVEGGGEENSVPAIESDVQFGI